MFSVSQHPFKALAFFCLLMTLSLPSWAAELKVTVDKQRLTQDDYLTLSLQLINSDTRLRAEGIDPNVDLTLLAKAFDVGTPTTTFRYRLQRTHGRATSELKVTLFPKHTGTLKIPAFLIDGLNSQPIAIHVLKNTATQPADVFTQSGWINKPSWQGETQILYLDLFHRVPLKAASLGGPFDSEPKDIFLERLPDKDRTEELKGLEYQVTRTSWSITTQQNNYDFFIPDVWVETKAGQRFHFPVKKESLAVKELPPHIPDGILIGKPELSIENPATATVGELYTWTVQIKSQHHATQLPDQLPLTQTLQGQRLFQGAVSKSTTLVDQQLITVARYPLSFIPNKAEEIHLPIIKMSYFDRNSSRIKTIETEASAIQIHEKPVIPTATSNKEKLPILNTQPKTEASAATPSDTSLFWKISTAFFLCLWLITLFFIRNKKTRLPQAVQTHASDHNQSVKERLLALLESRSIEEGLYQWKQRFGHWPELENFALQVQQYYYSERTTDTTELKIKWVALEKEAQKIQQRSHLKDDLSWEDTILGNNTTTQTHTR